MRALARAVGFLCVGFLRDWVSEVLRHWINNVLPPFAPNARREYVRVAYVFSLVSSRYVRAARKWADLPAGLQKSLRG